MPTAPHWAARGTPRRLAGEDRQATRELENAREALGLGNLLEGRRRLEILVARFPSAAASEQARRELARLYASSSERVRSADIRSHPGHGPGGIKADGDRGVHLPVSLGTPATSGGASSTRDVLDKPRLTRAAEQDFLLHVGDRVFFDDRSAELSLRSRKLLGAQAEWLKQVAQATVTVEGHADEQGSAAFNQDLAARRARAVRDSLIAEGIEASRITVEIYGRQRPVALCADGRCAAQNRRVVTVLRGARAPGTTPRSVLAGDSEPSVP